MKYFDKPTQVSFYESADRSWHGGIAYRDEVICGCCGNVLKIKEIEQFAKNDYIEPGIQELPPWIPIDKEILGDNIF